MFASLGRLTCRDLVLNTRNHLASALVSSGVRIVECVVVTGEGV